MHKYSDLPRHSIQAYNLVEGCLIVMKGDGSRSAKNKEIVTLK